MKNVARYTAFCFAFITVRSFTKVSEYDHQTLQTNPRHHEMRESHRTFTVTRHKIIKAKQPALSPSSRTHGSLSLNTFYWRQIFALDSVFVKTQTVLSSHGGCGSVVVDSLLIVTPIVGFCNCSMFCCALLYVHSSFAIILMWKREMVALLSFSSWCLVIVVWLFLAVPWVCLQFVIVIFPDYTRLLFMQTDALCPYVSHLRRVRATEHQQPDAINQTSWLFLCVITAKLK